MKKFDYIIVGQGLAGSVLSFHLRRLGKRVLVIDKCRMKTSSKIALGVYNPMVLKRFTPCWNVEKQLEALFIFLDDFEREFLEKIHHPVKLWRKFHSIQEQNMWLEKSDHKRLKPFMKSAFIENPYKKVIATYGYGEVTNSGRVEIPKLIGLMKQKLENESCFLDEEFDYSFLKINTNQVAYKNILAGKIVFCEGHRLTNNPFFNYLPLLRTKGELITVKLKGLKVNELLKSSISILPLGDDEYKVGATFNWKDKDELCTDKGKDQLLDKLKEFVNVQPEIVKHEAGLRPTVKDRKSLLGNHPKHKNVFLFNGLGTRGLLISPYLSLQLIDFMEQGISLDPEVNIKRYQNYSTC